MNNKYLMTMNLKKRLATVIIALLCLLSVQNGEAAVNRDNGIMVTRHVVDNIWFDNDSAKEYIWDLSEAIEQGVYNLRIRTDADSVFDLTKMGQRMDFRLSHGRVWLWGVENSKMRLADSIGIPLVELPLTTGMDYRCAVPTLKSVGFSTLSIPDSVNVQCEMTRCGKMVFPDGDSLKVVRLNMDIDYDDRIHKLSYWFADSILVPVARQYMRNCGTVIENQTFVYTFPSELEETVSLYGKFVDEIGRDIFSDGLFEEGSASGVRGFVESQGGTKRGVDSQGQSVDVIIAASPGEDFTAVITDAKGIVWYTREGKTDFNSVKIIIDGLPTGYYLVSVKTAGGEHASVKYYHEAR